MMKKLAFLTLFLTQVVHGGNSPQLIKAAPPLSLTNGTMSVQSSPTFSGTVTAPTFKETTATASSVGVFDASKNLASLVCTNGQFVGFTGGVPACLVGSSGVAWGGITGTLSNQTDLQNALNAKQNTLTLGDLTDTGTDGIVVTSGVGAVVGSGTSLAQHVADTTHNGYLSSADWNTFNGKQAAGSYLTGLIGDGVAAGPGSSALTLATVNANVGSFTNAAVTVNAKGLVTAASSGTTGNLSDAGTDGITVGNGTGAVLGTGTTISQHVADTTHNGYLSSTDWNTFNGKQATGNYATSGSGDVSWSAPSGAGPVTTSISAATVTGKALTGFSAGAGTVTASDTILTAFNKIWGWVTNLWVDEINGQIETVSVKTYVLIAKARYARTVDKVYLACNTSGSVTVALKIGGTNITSCNGISVSNTPADTTCTAANSMNAGDQLTLVTSSNSACLDLIFTVQTTRD